MLELFGTAGSWVALAIVAALVFIGARWPD